ncbi:hypothetical protein BDV09DRAFT_181131 [Aspergillus tetrazonus]
MLVYCATAFLRLITRLAIIWFVIRLPSSSKGNSTTGACRVSAWGFHLRPRTVGIASSRAEFSGVCGPSSAIAIGPSLASAWHTDSTTDSIFFLV